MNFTPTYGWYYISPSDRAAAWTGAKFLNKFLTTNSGVGPYGIICPLSQIIPGDIIQLIDENGEIYHSLFVVESPISPNPDTLLIATHTFDSDYRPLSTYSYYKTDPIHIIGIRTL